MEDKTKHIEKYKGFNIYKVVEYYWNPNEKNFDEYEYYHASRSFTDTKFAEVLQHILFFALGLSIGFLIGGWDTAALIAFVVSVSTGVFIFFNVMAGTGEYDLDSEDLEPLKKYIYDKKYTTRNDF